MDITFCPRCGSCRFTSVGSCADCGYMPSWKSFSGTYTPEPTVAQGWQCPMCKRILAPFMPYCMYCNEHMGSILPVTISECGNISVSGDGTITTNGVMMSCPCGEHLNINFVSKNL